MLAAPMRSHAQADLASLKICAAQKRSPAMAVASRRRIVAILQPLGSCYAGSKKVPSLIVTSKRIRAVLTQMIHAVDQIMNVAAAMTHVVVQTTHAA